jgi:tRNA threonylcarbamoyladenosine biosynthesis protein TsaE
MSLRDTESVLRIVVDSASAKETAELGEKLGRVLVAGDVVALAGDLGAGKTAFVQGLARGLGIRGRVSSPTFTIVDEHEDGRVPLYHADFYRLEEAGELDAIGFDDYFARGGVVVVEWADRFPRALPDERLDLRIAITGPATRRFTVIGPARLASALQ